MIKLPKNYQSGQTILVILLITAVILTIGLSAISSSITDIKISQETEEASRAYYVAESAIEEQMLASSQAPLSGELGGVKYDVTKTEKGGTEFLFPNKVEAGDAQTLWLVAHNSDGSELVPSDYYKGANFSVYWNGDAAVMIDLIYNSSNTYKIFRQNCDANSGRIESNHFTLASSGSAVEGTSLQYSCLVTIPSGTPYLAKITPLYNQNPISLGFKNDGSANSFPKQGDCFDSKGTVIESGVTRRINQCKLWPDIPNIFTWGLFSGGGDLKKSF